MTVETVKVYRCVLMLWNSESVLCVLMCRQAPAPGSSAMTVETVKVYRGVLMLWNSESVLCVLMCRQAPAHARST